MRNIVVAIFILFNFISAKAQTKYFEVKDVMNGESFHFPIFNNSKDSITSRKINQFLQLKELEQLCDSKLENIFNVVAKDDNDLNGGSKYDIKYEITTNNSKLLCLNFSESYCGATCTYWTGYYVFNSGNGDLVKLKDLFTEAGFKVFNKTIVKRRIDKFKIESKKLNPEVEEELSINIDCLKTDKLDNFYIKDTCICIDGDNCLSKNQKFDDLDMVVSFNLSEFKPYLNACGRAVFGLSNENISKFRSNDLPQLFEGTIGKNIIVMIIENSFDDGIYGNYAYLKYRKCINISGKLNGEILELKENDDETDNTGTFNAIFDGKKMAGSWTNKDKTKTYKFEAKRK